MFEGMSVIDKIENPTIIVAENGAIKHMHE